MSDRQDKRRQPRWVQRIIAQAGHYFWLPCPICGEDFGGHEWAGTLRIGGGQGIGVCANCVERAAELSVSAGEIGALFHLDLTHE